MKNIYENKQTGQKVVTDEKLDKKHWKLIKQWKDAQMKSNQVRTK